MFSEKAPPHMLVLLWHHWIYYKRHWIMLLVTLLAPFIIFGGLYLITNLLVEEQYQPCSGYVESPFSDGPLSSLVSGACKGDIPNGCVPKIKHPFERVLDAGFILEAGWKCDKDPSWKDCEFNKYSIFDESQEHPWCAMTNYDILFYPNTTFPKLIMEKVRLVMEDFGTLVKFEGPIKGMKGLPLYIANALGNKPNAFKDSNARIIGFESLSELLEHTRSMSRKNNSTKVPNLWGALSFSGLPEQVENAKHISYDILYDTKAKSDTKNLVWLQELVERAIVEVVSEKPMSKLGVAFKPVPVKCWHQPHNEVYTYGAVVLSMAIIISFLSSPANFLTQVMNFHHITVLTEKELKLREYLYIMGVGSMTLKISWLLFYCIFLIPLSIIFATMIYLLPGNLYTRTDPSVLFLLLIGYNVSQLAFCYMLSHALQQPRRSSIIFTFLHMFFTVIALAQVVSLNITGIKLVSTRITSLYPVVPLVIAVKYINSWEGQWIGAQWSNFFLSPVPTDEYGGIGEAFLWMIADIFIYMLLAWYFEKVFPGEFGQKLKFYFPFLPSYWYPKQVQFEIDPPNTTINVEHVDNKDPGVILDKLTKVYTHDKIGVNQLSLTFYKDEITAFLGQNGAGKSTTMNSLVGLISATSGKASVHGYDMDMQMDDIRRIVGFVPQYDILYPSMTVQEHIQFFGWLKGMTTAEIQLVTVPLLKTFGIDKLKSCKTTVLSGGQKRKLSILTGYLGHPKVIIFDEPTSGVDPFSRRSIWELILNHKKHNTTILSTHDMDEADLLGDRIAIISDGQLCCAGTPMYLKNSYGKGFRLTLACKPICDKHAIGSFVSNHIPNSRLLEERGTDMDYSIPIEIAHSSEIIDILKRVEEEQDSLDIVSYGISEPTMEDIFFAAADIEKDVSTAGMMYEGIEHAPQLGTAGIELAGSQNDLCNDDVQYCKRAGSMESVLQQGLALFYKRLLMAIFSWSGLLLQIGLPLAFIILMVLVGGVVKQFGIAAGTVTSVNVYDPARTNIMFVSGWSDSSTNLSTDLMRSMFKVGNPPVCPSTSKCTGSIGLPALMTENPDKQNLNGVCSSCRAACDDHTASQAPHGVIPSGDTVYRVSNWTNFTEWILHINQTQANVIAGFEFHETDIMEWDQIPEAIAKINKTLGYLVKNTTPTEYVTVWYQPKLRQAVVSLWNTYLLRLLKKDDEMSISMNLRAEVLGDSSQSGFLEEMLYNMMYIFVSSFFLAFCFAFGTFGIAVFIQYENSSGLKRLQLIYGANPFVYWIANFVFDFLLYFITVMLVAFVLGITDNAFNTVIGPIISIALPYGLMTIAFFYLLSFMFQKTKSIIVTTVILTMIIQQVGSAFIGFELMARWYECASGASNYSWVIPLNYFLRCIPAYLIIDSVMLITVSLIVQQIYGQHQGSAMATCFSDLQSWDLLGKRIFMAFLFTFVYLAVVLVLEWFDVRIDIKKLFSLCKPRNQHNVLRTATTTDGDVLEEKGRVERGDAMQDPLVVRNLTKIYYHKFIPAVDAVTFGVNRSQTFGLLGVNGAGKTTIFKMLTGYLEPTAGEAMLENNHLFGSKKSCSRFRDSSYCPQDNTLFDSLTVEQHLRLYATLRAIPSQVMPDVIRSLIHEVGLEIHKGKRAAQLSGGNQRKLQFALALLDYRPVIFLDEPTTGMDPGARRKAWNSIKRATDRGCSVVLTSHSMEECEALCHRIVIMVSGSFQCIGSVQYLKDKFGNKYTFKIKLRPTSATQAENGLDQGSVCNRVKQFIHERVPYSQLQEEHATMLHFDVPCTPQLKLSDLFSVLQECRSQFSIEDVSVTQTTLEQIFINMGNAERGIITHTPCPMGTPAV